MRVIDYSLGSRSESNPESAEYSDLAVLGLQLPCRSGPFFTRPSRLSVGASESVADEQGACPPPKPWEYEPEEKLRGHRR